MLSTLEGGQTTTAYAPVTLPDGAVIREVYFYVTDNDPHINISVGLRELGFYPNEGSTTYRQPSSERYIVTYRTSGTPGEKLVCQTGLAIPVNNKRGYHVAYVATGDDTGSGTVSLWYLLIGYTLPGDPGHQ